MPSARRWPPPLTPHGCLRCCISNWFADELNLGMMRHRAIGGVLKEEMRYGENPHQAAGFYITGENRPGVATAALLQGKQLSYNNINDTDAAYELVAEFRPEQGPACAIIKHANPCGVATGSSLADAYRRALACDSTSAFGGIIALNQELDAETAQEIVKLFTKSSSRLLSAMRPRQSLPQSRTFVFWPPAAFPIRARAGSPPRPSQAVCSSSRATMPWSRTWR